MLVKYDGRNSNFNYFALIMLQLKLIDASFVEFDINYVKITAKLRLKQVLIVLN